MTEMNDASFDSTYAAQYGIVCGTDEAGRGPLAGPVVAAAVVLPEGLVIEGLDDSKKLTEKKREKLFDEIIEKALAFGIAQSTQQEIDEINILEATLLAMRRAVDGLDISPDYLLVDGNIFRGFDKPGEAVIKGDAKSITIAAASIVAKVTRDDMMIQLHEQYPNYNLKQNKGYCTPEHMRLLKEHGITDIHRRTYEPVCSYVRHDEQMTLDELLEEVEN